MDLREPLPSLEPYLRCWLERSCNTMLAKLDNEPRSCSLGTLAQSLKNIQYLLATPLGCVIMSVDNNGSCVTVAALSIRRCYDLVLAVVAAVVVWWCGGESRVFASLVFLPTSSLR